LDAFGPVRKAWRRRMVCSVIAVVVDQKFCQRARDARASPS
jgi:hypothetical protein